MFLHSRPCMLTHNTGKQCLLPLVSFFPASEAGCEHLHGSWLTGSRLFTPLLCQWQILWPEPNLCCLFSCREERQITEQNGPLWEAA